MTIAAAGIDAGRKTPDIHLNGRDHAAANGADGFRKVAGVLRDGGAERVVMEATGRMRRALHQSLHDRGFAVLVVNPRQSRDFANATGGSRRRLQARRSLPGAATSRCRSRASAPPRRRP